MRYFLLDNECSLIEIHESNQNVWKLWMSQNIPRRVVGRQEIHTDYVVTTIFIGRHDTVEDPAPFITAIFDPSKTAPIFTCRWRTWDEAKAGHKTIVIRAALRWIIEREHEGYPIQ